jgi:hypothetical protein
VQVFDKIREGDGVHIWLVFKGWWYRYLLIFRKFLVYLFDEIPEDLGKDTWWKFGGIWNKYLTRSWKILV